MASVASNGWQVDLNTENAMSANWAALATTTPGVFYEPAIDPLFDSLDGIG